MEGLESPEGDETKTFEGSRVAELGSIDSKSIDRGSFFRSSIATRLDPPQSSVDHKSLVVKPQIRHLATRAFLSLRFRAWPRPLSSRTVVSLGRRWGLSPDLTTNSGPPVPGWSSVVIGTLGPQCLNEGASTTPGLGYASACAVPRLVAARAADAVV